MIVELDNHRVALDAGALGFALAGITRYLRSILTVWYADDSVRFPAGFERDPSPRSVVSRPLSQIRRLISQTMADGARAFFDAPDVYWGPAHRLPLILPKNIGSVVTVHDLCWRHAPETMRPASRLLDSMLMGRSVDRADRVIAVSQSTADDIVSLWPKAQDKIRITPLAGSLPVVPGAAGPLSERFFRQYFLFVGTFEPRKNLSRLLQAYAIAGARDPNWPALVLCGARGWGGVDPRAESQKLGIEAQVKFVKEASDEVLARLYRDAICLVMPSLYEGFGLPIVESMTQGRPVLTSNCWSMPEVAGEGGLFVDPLSVSAIAEGLRVMAKDDRLREAFADNAVKRAKHFSWLKTANATKDILLNAAR